MRQDLDNKLCTDFPLLYADRNASMQVTCMCWGFPGDGWYDLIREASGKLEALISLQLRPEDYKASQVKEKFGTLCFYMTGETPEMRAIIKAAEAKSAVTCEECGAPGKLIQAGWWYTACPTHTDEEDKPKRKGKRS
jgi:hypothetical protein